MASGASSVRSAGVADPPSPLRAWWAIFILFLAYMLSYVDRTIIALLVEPLRADLGLSDTQISLLQGLAFAIFYSGLSIPIAVLADRHSRRAIIGAGILFWSAMTSACGLATSFWQLFLARMGVGVGEAALGPSAYSLIGDLFPEEKRGRAMAVFSSGVTIGGGLALVIGGMIIAFATRTGPVETWFGEVRPWQLVFLLLGPPGILVALLMATVPEYRAGPNPVATPSPPALPFLKAERRLLAPLFIGMSISGMMLTALLYWAPAYLMRVHGLTAPEAGRMLGLGLLAAGPLGALAGGSLADRWVRKGIAGAGVKASGVGVVIMTASGAAAPLAPTPSLSTLLFTIAFFGGGFAYPGGGVAVQKASPPRLRARVSAIYLFVVTLVSSAIGPTMVALFTDVYYARADAVGLSLVWTIGLTAPVSLVAIMLCARAFEAREIGRDE